MKKRIYKSWNEPGMFELTTSNVPAFLEVHGILEKGIRKIITMLPRQIKKLKPYIQIFILGHTKRHYFDGSIILNIHGQFLTSHFKGRTLINAVENGLKKLGKEVKNLKGRHFIGDSDFPVHV